MAVKKNSVLPRPEAQTLVPFHFTDDVFAKECPGLFEFLATATDNDAERKGGSVTLFASHGKLKACFCDRQTQLVFYADLIPAVSLTAQLEAILSGEHERWQPSGKRGGQVPF